VGSEKRERQREARLAKLEAEAVEARKSRTKRAGIRVAVAVVVIGGLLFAYSVLAGDDDSGDEAANDDTTSSTAAEDAGFTSAQCSAQAPPPEAWTEPDVADEVLAREAPDPAPPPAETAADALESETLTEGGGTAVAAAGDCIYVHYVGKIPDGTVFDESWSGGQPFPVLLGQGMVIPGWDQGLVGAKVGERRRLVIGSDLAYGAEGGGDTIPPNSPLAFEVDIVDVVPTELSPPAEGETSDTTASADPAAGTDTAETTATTAPAETTTSALPES
jgi:FKBP-type peptidyl-prolyl cis-trans isomerase